MAAKKNKAILCVDDDPMILMSLKLQLTQSFDGQFIIETAESGEEALELIDFLGGRDIDTLLIISDWLMPKMKGDELLVKIKDRFPKVGQIMLSGQAQNEAVQNAFKNSNLKYFISKPWNKQDLIDKVNEILKS
ncbi:response regulator [Bernardetia sp. Wsw4-3y2]|uniref:response regulator n=1 Tax=Bernardetia sp. Wsw4-3y2 TaxID=3127471 RepID=UPI0030D1D23A